MATTIKKLRLPKGGFVIGSYRFHLPVHVTSQCPECGKSVKLKLGGPGSEDFLKYPSLGVPIDLDFRHYFEGNKHADPDDHEWTVSVILDFTLTLAPQKT